MSKKLNIKQDRFIKSKQSIRLLLKNETFQDAIKNLRIKYKIPNGGFATEEENYE